MIREKKGDQGRGREGGREGGREERSRKREIESDCVLCKDQPYLLSAVQRTSHILYLYIPFTYCEVTAIIISMSSFSVHLFTIFI